MTRSKLLAKTTLLPGIYRHFKGQLYEVLGTVRHSESLEELILYKALYKNRTSALWVRPAEMFVEKVTVDGKTVARFEKQ